MARKTDETIPESNSTFVFMDEYDIIIADLVLKKMPLNQANTLGLLFWGGLLSNEYEHIGELNWPIVSVRINEPLTPDRVKNFLLENGYIIIVDPLPRYQLEKNGIEVRNIGGHNLYVNAENEKAAKIAAIAEADRREQRKMNWPQRHWILLLVITIVVVPTVFELVKYKLEEPKKKERAPALNKNDTTKRIKDTTTTKKK